jgi:hypothetical protein
MEKEEGERSDPSKSAVFKSDGSAAAAANMLVPNPSPLSLRAPFSIRAFLFDCLAAHRSQRDREMIDMSQLNHD